MIVLVTGGRKFNDAALLNAALDEIHAQTPITLLIHGTATGADTFAKLWAYAHNIECKGYRPDWGRYGNKAAGPIRNQLMLDDGKPDRVEAFPGNKGTADMVRRARKAGVPVKLWGHHAE